MQPRRLIRFTQSGGCVGNSLKKLWIVFLKSRVRREQGDFVVELDWLYKTNRLTDYLSHRLSFPLVCSLQRKSL